ncbi:MAG: UDP-N-acetylglucosamine 1-carboxyvinyltransferase [Alphaproteobacteria bacterium]
MDRIIIEGGNPLHGIMPISGGKNAALPLLTACLLSDQPIHFYNIPPLADIESLMVLLSHLGAVGALSPDSQSQYQAETGGQQISISCPKLSSTHAPYEMVRKMRASILVLGPILARAGHASISLPGGCAIGARPVDLHIEGLRQMGAIITIDEGYIKAEAPKGLYGAEISLPFPSVGATENLLMAATLAKGTTRLMNAAREPEIDELAHLLTKMGAKITGIGSSLLEIEGVSSLNQASHKVEADRIEAGSYAIAAAITGGELEIIDAPNAALKPLWGRLEKAGIAVTPTQHGIHIKSSNARLMGCDIMTEPFPGFPTDLQAQFMALMCVSDGASMITETIFENRFMHVPELQRMGANITLHGRSALVRGVPNLSGAEVMATDLRASMSLVLAGLAAQGKTVINRVYHLDRGYGRLVRKLYACGANIERKQD